MPGSTMSSVKLPRPVTWRGLSLLRELAPMYFFSAIFFYFFRRRLYRLDDLRVARAHAEVAGEAAADLVFARIGILAQKRVRGEDHARRAVAALKAVALDERLLHRMEPAVRLQSLDRGDFPAVRLHREQEARFHQLAVEQDRAGAALADDAADVRAGEAGDLAQKMGQEQPRLDLFFVTPAVDRHADGLLHVVTISFAFRCVNLPRAPH